ATQPPDAPRRAGPLRPVLLGLLRKNPHHRLTAAQAEKLLRAVASGETKVRLPRQGADPVTGTAPDQAARAAAMADAATGGPDGSGGTGRRWPWLVMAAAVVVGLVGAGVAVALADHGTRSLSAGPGPSTPVATTLTPGSTVSPDMGVQACTSSPPGSGVQVSGTRTLPGVRDAPPDGWLYYSDHAHFHIAVPQGWRVWRLGPLLCFRDPSSVRAAAVLSEGVRVGTTRDLIEADIPAWRQAAGLEEGFRSFPLVPKLMGDDAAAELEYTYMAGATTLHGANLLTRDHGDLYLLCWVAADYSWTTEQYLKNVFQSTFGLDS
ncbi:MAG: hypothetical protein ACM3JP_01220, partial [Betaproteobacteria bacterium]